MKKYYTLWTISDKKYETLHGTNYGWFTGPTYFTSFFNHDFINLIWLYWFQKKTYWSRKKRIQWYFLVPDLLGLNTSKSRTYAAIMHVTAAIGDETDLEEQISLCFLLQGHGVVLMMELERRILTNPIRSSHFEGA